MTLLKKLTLVIVPVVFTLSLISVWEAGSIAIKPHVVNVGAAPYNLHAEDIIIHDQNGAMVAGWLVSGELKKGVVLLLHGIRSDRRSLVGRAVFLNRAGYAVLMIDLAAHGESSGEAITFGFREADSVTAAIVFLRKKWPDKKIGVIGLSLGGAASLISSGKGRVGTADAYVLEAVFSRLAIALENRLAVKLGEKFRILSTLLLWQVPLRLGYDPDLVSPLESIKTLSRPVFVLAGELDRRTTMKDTKALLKSAKEPKKLWIIPDAKHQDFHRFVQQDYENNILSFFEGSL